MNCGDSNADGAGAARTRSTIQRDYTTMSAMPLRGLFILQLNSAPTSRSPALTARGSSARTPAGATLWTTAYIQWTDCSIGLATDGVSGAEKKGGANEETNRQAGG